jgi:phage baseplate assembly protein W
MSYRKNPSDKTGVVSTTARTKAFSDLNLKLTLHPVRKDIMPLKDDAAIKNSVKNLLLTNFFERPFQPDLGANLRALLFEPADAITRVAIRDSVKNTLIDKEPRIEDITVIVENDDANDAYRLTVGFSIKQIEKTETVEIVLKRLR